MPSTFSAKDNKALVATCCASQKTKPTVSMVSLEGRENGRRKHYSVCISCANAGWRPPGFRGVSTRLRVARALLGTALFETGCLAERDGFRTLGSDSRN